MCWRAGRQGDRETGRETDKYYRKLRERETQGDRQREKGYTDSKMCVGVLESKEDRETRRLAGREIRTVGTYIRKRKGRETWRQGRKLH